MAMEYYARPLILKDIIDNCFYKAEKDVMSYRVTHKGGEFSDLYCLFPDIHDFLQL